MEGKVGLKEFFKRLSQMNCEWTLGEFGEIRVASGQLKGLCPIEAVYFDLTKIVTFDTLKASKKIGLRNKSKRLLIAASDFDANLGDKLKTLKPPKKIRDLGSIGKCLIDCKKALFKELKNYEFRKRVTGIRERILKNVKLI